MSVVTRFINSSATTHQKAPNCNMWLTPLLITDMYPQQLDNMGHSSHNKVTTVDKKENHITYIPQRQGARGPTTYSNCRVKNVQLLCIGKQ